MNTNVIHYKVEAGISFPLHLLIMELVLFRKGVLLLKLCWKYLSKELEGFIKPLFSPVASFNVWLESIVSREIQTMIYLDWHLNLRLKDYIQIMQMLIGAEMPDMIEMTPVHISVPWV